MCISKFSKLTKNCFFSRSAVAQLLVLQPLATPGLIKRVFKSGRVLVQFTLESLQLAVIYIFQAIHVGQEVLAGVQCPPLSQLEHCSRAVQTSAVKCTAVQYTAVQFTLVQFSAV